MPAPRACDWPAESAIELGYRAHRNRQPSTHHASTPLSRRLTLIFASPVKPPKVRSLEPPPGIKAAARLATSSTETGDQHGARKFPRVFGVESLHSARPKMPPHAHEIAAPPSFANAGIFVDGCGSDVAWQHHRRASDAAGVWTRFFPSLARYVKAAPPVRLRFARCPTHGVIIGDPITSPRLPCISPCMISPELRPLAA